MWWLAAEGTRGSEEDEAGTETQEGVQENLLALIRGRKRSRAVRAESDPVSCFDTRVSINIQSMPRFDGSER